ncbi:attractin-like [Actinia tenebrosa]|uniref:Attractin-like n=1 Tax=Actinia tenebrosa TaxID=6105 RepID=A0A6P8HWJ1_ACTTE|nr:attractin-like [Actinia tenebrosa]
MFVVCRSRKTTFLVVIVCILSLVILLEGKSKSKCTCWRGHCDGLTGACVCKDGWFGERCQFCRQRLTADSGVITDGPGEYEVSSTCMWLIESKSPNSSIELSLEQFATECSWDNLYVYDGSSVQAPLLAAYSGVLRDNSSIETLKSPIRTLRSSSNTVYICFYSDKHIKDNGFRIKYSVLRECPSTCSFHGNCNSLGTCTCKPGWSGPTCNVSTCTYSCVHGTCNATTLSCDCQPGYSGPSCNSTSNYGFWSKHTAGNQDIIQGRASHAAGLLGDWLWVFGGYSLTSRPFNDLIRYSFSTNNWEIVSYSGEGPSRRYGHSLVACNNSIIIFGGVSLDGHTLRDLWHFNIITKGWKRVKFSLDSSLPIAVSGHSATLVNNKMIVFFGYGPQYGYTPYVQEFDLVTDKWIIYRHTLSRKGTYGHSSVYDPISGLIYVYAGTSSSIADKGVSDDLHSYNPVTHQWTKLESSSVAQYLHSAVLIGHLMLVYGGNTAISSSAATCFDSVFLAYDLICGKWMTMPKSALPITSHGSLGQSGFIYNRKMFIFGGFNGEMINDLLSYSLGDCSAWKNRTTCLAAHSLSGCFWDPLSNHCVSPSEGFISNDSFERPRCKNLCNASGTCNECNSQGLQCKWCDNKCKEKEDFCNKSQACKLSQNPHCKGESCQKLNCENHQTCQKCLSKTSRHLLSNQCMWCEAQKRCVVEKSYIVSFPYGQCNQLVTEVEQCPAVKCRNHKSCSSCHKLPGCGWCDDGSGTGIGRCLDGGSSGPFLSKNSIMPETCTNWFFINCPACQCNGHSSCDSRNKCIKCQHNTRGHHCQFCIVGFYGDPTNGDKCKECLCNKHAKECHPVTGKCDCLVKGIQGHHCQKCVDPFHGNASNGGLCFYRLQINDPISFNFSGKTNINLEFKPVLKEHDIEFMVAISHGPPAKINLTFLIKDLRSSTQKEKLIFKGYRLGKLNQKFSQREYAFHKKYVTFRAYIYNIDKSAPVTITAVFTQPSSLNIDLLEFFLTFFGCFLSLLCVASIGWRIRSRYHSYLLTRQNRAERNRMANRPFATINLLLPNEIEILTKSSPNPIAMEPLVKNKVAITTVVVLLPSGEDGAPPVGQCGICFASMLMSHGSHSHSGIRTRMGRKKNRKRATMTTYNI